MKTYLSGKISGDPNYKKKFSEAEKMLNFDFTYNQLGEIVNPINFTPLSGIKNWWCYMIVAIYNLLPCKKAFFLPDWRHSRGARIERKIALALGVICYDINEVPDCKKHQHIESLNHWWYVLEYNRLSRRDDLKLVKQKYVKV
jgi:hypothetical protein